MVRAAVCRSYPKHPRGICYTDAVTEGVFAIGYEWQTYITKAYLAARRQRPGRYGKADVELHLPADIVVTQRVDLLCRWVTVFDFPAGELLLFPYD